MASIYTHISDNKRDTWVIMFLFILIISVIGWVFGEIYSGEGLAIMAFALIFSGITSFISYYNSDKIVLAISKAKKVTEAEAPQLHALVENMSIASGLPKPQVYVIEDSAMNAFATGRDPEHGVICFTTGIIQKLDKRELEGVVAHEMSHIGNYDIRLMSLVSVLVGSIALIADWFTRGMFYGSRRRNSNGGGNGILMIVGLVLIILSPIIATLIKLAVSRKREFLADSSAAMITRYPQGLANALRKLSADREVLEVANGATAHLYISNPLKNNGGGLMANLFSTHPPVEERIRRLESM